jgi:hypothetical protein
MIRMMLAILGLSWNAEPQAAHPGTNVLVVPTTIAVTPLPFSRGQVVAVSASFQQQALPCLPSGSRGFGLRLFDEKKVPTEPTGDTTYMVASPATLGPQDGEEGRKVERAFEPFAIPQDAPGRIYVTVWQSCTFKLLVDPNAVPPIYEEVHNDVRIGGRFFRYSCPGSGKIPTGLCAYRPEE